MSLTVGELSAILKVENRQFEEALKSAKKHLERAAAEADDFGDESQQSFNKAERAADKFDGEVKNITKNVKKAKNPMEKLGKSIGTAFKVGVVVAFGKQILDATMQMANLALEAEESAAAFEITFGSAAKETTRFVHDMAHAFGMTRAEMQQQMAVTGSVIQGLGFTSDAAADMSTEIMNLSGDLAAFMNIQEGAIVPANAITKALTGEREMLKSMGIVLRQVEVDQKALTMTNKASTSQLTDQERAAASLMLIEEKMGHIKGQLGREAEGAANQMRQLRAEFKEARTEVGEALLPAFEVFIPVVRDLIPVFKTIMSTVSNVVQILLGALMPALEPVKQIFELLAPIIEASATVIGSILGAALSTLGEILKVTIIPLLEGVAKIAEIVTGIFDEAAKQTDKNAESNYAYADALIAAKKQSIENIQAGKGTVYQLGREEEAIKELEAEIFQLEQAKIKAMYAEMQHGRAQAEGTAGTEDYGDAVEETEEAIKKQTLQLDKNTQAKLNNVSVSNEAVSAMLNLVNAIQRVTDIQSREQVETDKLNELLKEQTRIQKILNAEKGKGEKQTEVELAQIAKLKAKEEALLTQQQKGLDLKLEIASAELDLEDAITARDEKGEEADARDDLSIKQARQRLKELQTEQANSKDVTIELASVQQNLETAIANSTKATQEFITAEKAMDKLNTAIGKQRAKRDEAKIDTDAEQLELAEAKLALEAALLTAQDKNVLKESRATLGRVLGLDTAGVNKLFDSLGLDTSAFKRISGLNKDFNFDPETEQALNNNGKGDGSSGTGKPADPPPADPPPQESFVDAINKALRGGGGGFGGASLGHGGATEINDSMFDLGNANSVASQFLKTRNETVVNISVDPTLDAEARVDKTMSDINDRIQVKNRFRAL
jgi:hypothetical protein